MNAIVEQMKSEIESLTKERDKFKAAYYSAEKCASDLSIGCAKLQTERDALTKERDQLQDEITELTSEEHSIPELRTQLHEAFEEKRKCYFAVSQQALAITNLVKERDECRRQSDLQMNSAIKFCQERNAARIERDALAAARYAYASEFSLDEEGQPDVGSIHQNIRALKASGNLALDALYTSSHYTSALPEYHLSDFEVNEAIAALRQVGVK